MGGGNGRNVRLARPTEDDGLFWTQDELKGGHNVPLSSTYTRPAGPARMLTHEFLFRLHECAVFCRDHPWYPCADCMCFFS